jgi:pimeloyl-ACP methyl ester carboxylesterase
VAVTARTTRATRRRESGHHWRRFDGKARLVDIGGRKLLLDCAGSGSPAVILEAGFGDSSFTWASVLPRLVGATRTCAYDRAGLGTSVAMPGVHDAADEVNDLERLLERARIEPPYVLVGHSYGGLLARLFAHEHPDSVAGVVLIDAMGRDQTRRQLAIWPKSQAAALRRYFTDPVVNGVDLRAGEALAAGIQSLADKPLVVITAGRLDAEVQEAPRSLRRAQGALWGTLQAELARLSSDHAHVVALRSTHMVQRVGNQPMLVARAIRAVVQAHPDGAPLPSCEQLFRGPGVRCIS